MAGIKFFKNPDKDLLQVGSLVFQVGRSYPAEIMVYGDLYVLRCTKANCIIRRPKAERVCSNEPYISSQTFVELTKNFTEVPVEVQPFTMDNKLLFKE